MKINIKISSLLIPITLLVFAEKAEAQNPIPEEAKYYKIVDVPIPEEIKLEVGGLALTEDNKLGVSTRRGEVWLISNPESKTPNYSLFAEGLHEVLGLGYKDNGFYLAQRAELTRIEDTDGDGMADLYKTIYSWPLSGNYHEYSYGPKFRDNGDMVVTLNLSWIGYGESLVRWRGWMLNITPDGKMTPIATGLRSPAGFVINEEGDTFYTENQGDWVGSGRMTHLASGDFAGNPGGLEWTDDPLSPLKLKKSDIEKESGISLYEYAKKVPNMKAPAVWFPHTALGISTSDILIDNTNGKFGPFTGQWFVGDQGHSKIMRVYMEKINGVYQGAAFPFIEGFSSGILRMIWGQDNNMFVGMTSRGWSSTGPGEYGLQRLIWTGTTPFEIKTLKAQNDGFVMEFTKPVNRKTAEDPNSYSLSTFTYHYHYNYGSEVVDQQAGIVRKAEVSSDGTSVKLTLDGMRMGFIHQVKATGVKSTNGENLLHNTGYYTLNEVPGGELKSKPVASEKEGAVKQPKRVNQMPVTWVKGPDKTFQVGTLPGLKFDTEEITVESGQKIQISLNNNDDMMHNLVILKPGDENADKIGQAAIDLGIDGAGLNYVPDSDIVMYHTGILEPGTTESIYFVAPREKGVYWIICTFPGHSLTMRAKLIVE